MEQDSYYGTASDAGVYSPDPRSPWIEVDFQAIALYDLEGRRSGTLTGEDQVPDPLPKCLPMRRLDRLQINFQYCHPERPDRPVWFYGCVLSHHEAAFPNAPIMDIIPANYVKVLDIEHQFNQYGKEELAVESHVLEMSELWPPLVRQRLLQSENLLREVEDLTRALGSIEHDIRDLKRESANVEGVFEVGARNKMKKLTLKVDAMNRLLGYDDVMARGEDAMPIPVTSTVDEFHEKLTSHSVDLARLSSPEVIAAHNTPSPFRRQASCCLFLKLARLSSIAPVHSPTNQLFARVTLLITSLDPGAQSPTAPPTSQFHTAGRSTRMQPWVIPIAKPRESYDCDRSPDQYQYCVFKNIPLDSKEIGQDSISVVIDIIELDPRTGSQALVRSSKLPPEQSASGHDDLLKGGKVQQQQIAEFEFQTALIQINDKQQPQSRAMTLKRSSIGGDTKHMGAEPQVTFKCHLIPGEYEDLGLETLPFGGKRDPNVVISSSIADNSSQPDAEVQNLITIRLQKLFLEKKETDSGKSLKEKLGIKDTEREKLRSAEVCLMKKSSNGNYQIVPDCIKLGVGNGPKISVYHTEQIPTVKPNSELSSDTDVVNDVIMLDMGAMDSHWEYFVRMQLAKCWTVKSNEVYGEAVLPLTTHVFGKSPGLESGKKELKIHDASNDRPHIYERLDHFYVTSDREKDRKEKKKHQEERLEVLVVFQSAFTTSCEKTFALLTQGHPGDEKFYRDLQEVNWAKQKTIRMLPYVILRTMENMSADPRLTEQAMRFVSSVLYTLASTGHTRTLRFLHTDFLLLITRSDFWRHALRWICDELFTQMSDLPAKRQSQQPESTSQYQSLQEVAAESRLPDPKFLANGLCLLAWARRSYQLERATENRREQTREHLIGLKNDILKHATAILDRRSGERLVNLNFFLVHFLDAFPQFSEEICKCLNHVRKFVHQVDYCSRLLELSVFKANSVRRVISAHIKNALCHTVKQESAVQSHYDKFSKLLLKIVTTYRTIVQDSSVRFAPFDSDFLLPLFENTEFWVQHAPPDLHGASARVHQERMLCAATECVALFGRVSASAVCGEDTLTVFAISRQLLKLSIAILNLANRHLRKEYTFLQLKMVLTIYEFICQSSDFSPYPLIVSQSLEPDFQMQLVSVFQLLFQATYLLVTNRVLLLENFSLPKQRMISRWIKTVPVPSSVEDEDDSPDTSSHDLRRIIGKLLVDLHSKLVMPLLRMNESGKAVSKFFSDPYPVAWIIPMCLCSVDFRTRADMIKMLADIYCFFAKSSSDHLYSELVKEVDTCMGFKQELGDENFIDQFHRSFLEKIKECEWISNKKQAEMDRIELVTNTQMKDLLSIRRSSISQLDPDLLILYMSDLVSFYAREVSSDISENLLYIRYQWHLYTVNVQHDNMLYAAETLMEFVLLLERLDHIKHPNLRPFKLDFMKEEIPDKFFKRGMTTVDLSIELLTEAAEIYEDEKLFEIADGTRDLLNSQLLRNLDYLRVAENNLRRADLAYKITGTSLEEQRRAAAAEQQGAADKRKQKKSTSVDPNAKKQPNMVNTRMLNQKFYFVHFKKDPKFPKVLAGNSFVYRAKDGMTLGAFKDYLQRLFSNLSLTIREENQHDYIGQGVGYAHQQVPDILYAEMQPAVFLPKRFKSQIFLQPDSFDIEMYRVYGMTSLDKRLRVDVMHGLEGLSYSDNVAKLLLTLDERADPKKVEERRRQLYDTAAPGSLETSYDVCEDGNIYSQLCCSERVKSPGRCRWQQLKEKQARREVYSCVDAARDANKYLRVLCEIYRKCEQTPPEQVQPLVLHLKQVASPLVAIHAPIQGGFKRLYLAFNDSAFRDRVAVQAQIDEFTVPFGHLMTVLRELGELCRKVHDENRENDVKKQLPEAFKTLDDIAITVAKDMSWAFRDQPQTPEDVARRVRNAFEYLEKIHLSRINKRDPAIHDSNRNFERSPPSSRR